MQIRDIPIVVRPRSRDALHSQAACLNDDRSDAARRSGNEAAKKLKVATRGFNRRKRAEARLDQDANAGPYQARIQTQWFQLHVHYFF